MIDIGTIATDTIEQSEVVVIKIIPDRCDDVVVKQGRYSEQTVYDFNKRYSFVDPDEPVVEAVYSGSLPSDPTELSKDGRCIMAKNSDAKQYKFPITRLEPID